MMGKIYFHPATLERFHAGQANLEGAYPLQTCPIAGIQFSSGTRFAAACAALMPGWNPVECESLVIVAG